MTDTHIDHLTGMTIGAAIAVHRELGPGLLESAYEACLTWELQARGLVVERQKGVPVKYRGLELDCAYRMDLLVEGRLVVELKTVERFDPIHTAQMLTYLKLSGCQAGLLINFHVPLLRDGIRRIVHGLPEPSAVPPRPRRLGG